MKSFLSLNSQMFRKALLTSRLVWMRHLKGMMDNLHGLCILMNLPALSSIHTKLHRYSRCTQLLVLTRVEPSSKSLVPGSIMLQSMVLFLTVDLEIKLCVLTSTPPLDSFDSRLQPLVPMLVFLLKSVLMASIGVILASLLPIMRSQ